MTTVNLELKYGLRAARETHAWYIPGDDSADWLEEVTSWDVDQTSLLLLPIAHSSDQRDACGVLVTLDNGRLPATTSGRCLPYGSIAERLYLPVEALLSPAVSETEIGDLLSEEYTYVWHPVAGLVAFEPGEALRLSGLLQFGPASEQQWDLAQPGVSTGGHLVSLAPVETLNFEQLLRDAQDDIGTDRDSLSDLPPSPNEPSPGLLSAAGRQGMRMAAGMAQWFARQLPQGVTQSNLMSGIGRWAQQRLAEISERLNAARHREIERLLHLLQSDPDKGLRYALPMGGDAHRGRGAPGGRLVERIPDFSLGGLGGGGAADFWEISADYQYRLLERYRELANREMQLGRFRRAAYIFAQLLGDYQAAAEALKQGRHWREAAVLYRQRLNRPWDAADCLVQGGLWMEAITLYEELEAHEKAGDLYLKLDQHENAHDQFQLAVEKHRRSEDRLSAARLLEQKLNSPDAAIDELAFGWPHAPQAVKCLRELFSMFGRLARHQSAHTWIDHFQSQPLPGKNRIELANVLADTSTKYPDQTVQERAADCTRSVVSRQLRDVTRHEGTQLLSALSRLVPEDRLLSRDCRRYYQHQTIPGTDPESYSLKNRPRLVKSFRLPRTDVMWRAATVSRHTLFAAGYTENQLVLTRCSWDEAEPSVIHWSLSPGHSGRPILLAADPSAPRSVVVHEFGAPPLTSLQKFEPTDRTPYETVAGATSGMTASVLGMACSTYGITWLLEVRNGEFTLVALGRDGEQISTQTVPSSDWTIDSALTHAVLPIPLLCRGAKVYVALNNRLLIIDRDKPPETVEFEQEILGLTGSHTNTRSRIVLSFARGGTIFWDDMRGNHTESFAGNLTRPLVCLNRGGYLIAVGDDSCVIFGTHDGRLQFINEMTDVPPNPIAVLPGPHTKSFVIVSRDGQVLIYDI